MPVLAVLWGTIMNILIVKLSAIGDVIHALPVSYAIKETYPDAHITWVVEPPAKPLLENNPYIDEILVFEKKKFKSVSGFFKNYGPFREQLCKRKYDIALDLQGLGKSAAIVLSSGAKKCYGTCNMRELSNYISTPVCGKNAQGHIVERYLDVARAIGCKVNEVVLPLELTEKEEKNALAVMRQAGVPDGAAYVVMAVGANWPNKRWPVRSYAALSDRLYGEEIIPVFVGGGAVDEGLIAEIEKAAEIPPVNLIGKTSLRELAAVIKGARAIVGGDTGPVHLSAGLKKPTIMVMGPTDANRNGPYRQTENAIEAPRDCKYCWKRACPKGEDCLAAITLEMVWGKLKPYIG